jgi:hypothetical protein
VLAQHVQALDLTSKTAESKSKLQHFLPLPWKMCLKKSHYTMTEIIQ